ncbi:unnamed protein product [Strongylus vulgaris]|uniref:Uncharacterized protein n=1 Tax=Strongylus vulgaris TaxID=40348 RepID=A0A3P7IYF7_STRVU|nr:unnamed protein product [Strongylus vulgaris]
MDATLRQDRQETISDGCLRKPCAVPFRNPLITPWYKRHLITGVHELTRSVAENLPHANKVLCVSKMHSTAPRANG